MADKETKPMFSSAWYDRLKFVALVLLPGAGALYFGLAQIWGLPKAEEVTGSVTVLVTFLGLLLKVSTSQYYNSDVRYDGVIQVEQVPGGPKRYSMELNTDPDELDTKKAVVFKINPQ